MIEKYYARVSKKKDKGISINAQVSDALKEKISKKRIYIDDGKTAGLDNDNPKDIKFFIKDHWFWAGFNLKKRPDFERMIMESIEDSKKDKVIIKVIRWDRFSRVSAFQKLIIAFLNISKIICIATHDTNDPFARSIVGEVAEKERDNVKERIDITFRYKFEQGYYLGGKLKKGYKRLKIILNGKEYKTLELDPTKKKEIEMVKIIKRSKYSKELCKKLGIHPQTFYNIKKDPFYEGYVEYQGEKRKGKHKPIIKEMVSKDNKLERAKKLERKKLEKEIKIEGKA